MARLVELALTSNPKYQNKILYKQPLQTMNLLQEHVRYGNALAITMKHLGD